MWVVVPLLAIVGLAEGMRVSSVRAGAQQRQRAARVVDAASAKALSPDDWSSERWGPLSALKARESGASSVARAYGAAADMGLAPTFGTAQALDLQAMRCADAASFYEVTGLSLESALSPRADGDVLRRAAASPWSWAALLGAAALAARASAADAELALPAGAFAAAAAACAAAELAARFGRRSDVSDERVAAHEAGHLLVAWLLGMPALATVLSPAEALLRGERDAWAAPCSVLADAPVGAQQRRADQRAVVLMAGAAAEALLFGDALTGADDEIAFERLAGAGGKPAALANAVLLLRCHAPQLDRVRGHLEKHRGASIGETMLAIDDDGSAPDDGGAGGAAGAPGLSPARALDGAQKQVRAWAVSAAICAAAASAASPALALVPEFDAVREEAAGRGLGGISRMAADLETNDFRDLNAFTKTYDLDFRKAKMGAAKKKLPKGPQQGEAQLLMNGVTFDLIGLNKAVRVEGKEDKQEATKWFGQLKVDVDDFLKLEPTELPAAAE
ncbi:hypothetical protein M885DRAFT_559042 [Pelagophyceae sp. CCMP2097]|nr:hypothetical protein M885DRAFT_559042 [Pelagophyceae sp. CCMP2097]